MDRYVYKLETSYMAELHSLKTSLQHTQDRMDALEAWTSALEHKLSQSKAMGSEHVHSLDYAIITVEDLGNRNQRNNIRVRGQPKVQVPRM